MEEVKKVGIIGVGLLGGSIGLALKARFQDIQVLGMGRTKAKLEKAVHYKAIDSYDLSYEKGVQDCDIVIIATPVATIVPVFQRIQSCLKRDAVVTDVGSTKVSICKAIEENVKYRHLFVGSHPMAGSENTGVESARADLYLDSTVVIIENSYHGDQIKRVESFWKALGAQTIKMTPEQHDRLTAYTSHLPHVVATCLSYTLSQSLTDEDLKVRVFGNGLVDTTRIAEGDPEIWLDILITNRDHLLAGIKDFRSALLELEQHLQDMDHPEVIRYLKEGKRFREKIMKYKEP
ncbi:MAG: prephenate dehydrogenase [bacterium]|nr:MAG: prephenate dehydrogenase [bacterium]